MEGQVLESFAGSKYLGVGIRNNLPSNSQIQNVFTLASGPLRKIRSKNPELREMAYKTHVRPLVEYSSSVWSSYTKSNIARLEMVQRRAVRWTLSEYSPYASVTQMLQPLGWRSFEQRRFDSRLCLFYKIIYGLVSIDMPPYVVHPLRTLRNPHTLASVKFNPLKIANNTHSIPSQSCNGTSCQHT